MREGWGTISLLNIPRGKRNDDLGRAQVVQGMAVRELSDLELVIISGWYKYF